MIISHRLICCPCSLLSKATFVMYANLQQQRSADMFFQGYRELEMAIISVIITFLYFFISSKLHAVNSEFKFSIPELYRLKIIRL